MLTLSCAHDTPIVVRSTSTAAIPIALLVRVFMHRNLSTVFESRETLFYGGVRGDFRTFGFSAAWWPACGLPLSYMRGCACWNSDKRHISFSYVCSMLSLSLTVIYRLLRAK